MRVTLISHASLIFETEDTVIWTNPWLSGRAYNNSWALYPAACVDAVDYSSIQYLFISHNRADTLHVPTLENLPTTFKDNVVVLLQNNIAKALRKTLESCGFKHFQALPNREKIELTDKTTIYSYQVGSQRSALFVSDDKDSALNINCSSIGSKDCDIIKKDVGAIKTIFNQFSITSYSGHFSRGTRIPKIVNGILNNMIETHKALEAQVTIPTSSFFYYCREDNTYLNNYSNTVFDVRTAFDNSGLKTTLLYPGHFYDFNEKYDDFDSVAAFIESYNELNEKPLFDVEESKTLEEINQAFSRRCIQIHQDNYVLFLMKVLRPITISITDLKLKVQISLHEKTFKIVDNEVEHDLEMSSQPLWYLFTFPWGGQTLDASGRYMLIRSERNWNVHRQFFTMNNREAYMSHKLLSPKNITKISSRMVHKFTQFTTQLSK